MQWEIKMFFVFRVFIFSLVYFIPISVYSKDTINWLYPDFPPTNIVSGAYKGQGVVNKMQKTIFKHLSNYEHIEVTANFARILENMKKKQNICSSALLWNESRAKIIEYSIESFWVYPNMLIIKKEDINQFKEYKDFNGNYSLEDILKDKKLILGYSFGRSYGTELDKILKQYVNSKNSIPIAQQSLLKGLLEMLERDRFDYTLGYSHEVGYVDKEYQIKGEFISLPLAEANKLIPVYIGCSKNEMGREIIKKLNKYLKKVRTTTEHYNPYLKWIDSNARDKYPKLIKSYLIEKKYNN